MAKEIKIDIFKLDLEEVGKRSDNPQIFMYKGLDLRNILYAPTEYWKLNLKEHKEICNKAGPKGYGWLVPNTIWGLNIGECANIHDFLFYVGKTIEDKDAADRIFLNNMLRLINLKTKWGFVKYLRIQRASKYYAAVCIKGGPAFWKGKNQI